MSVTEAERRERLQARLDQLNERLRRIEDDLDAPRSKDDEDRAIEAETDEVMESLGGAGLREIAQIEAALRRIDDGTYGYCVKCGEAIAVARLDLLPATPFCARCSP